MVGLVLVFVVTGVAQLLLARLIVDHFNREIEARITGTNLRLLNLAGASAALGSRHFARATEGLPGLVIAAYGEDGRRTGGSEAQTPALPERLDAQTMEKARARPGVPQQLDVVGRRILVGPAIVYRQGRGFLAMTDSWVAEEFFRARNAVVAAHVAGILLIAGAVALGTGAWLRGKLARAAVVVHRIAQGGLGERLPDAGADETGQLARDFNHMAERIETLVRQLEAADERRRRMFADWTHEVGTPLTSVLGYLEALQGADTLADPARRERYLKTAYEQAQALESLLDDLATLSRIEDDDLGLEIDDLDLCLIAQGQIDAMQATARQRGVELLLADDTAVNAACDRARVAQVLRIALSNAIRHSHPGGAVTVRAGVDGARRYLEVVDHGDGIAPEHLARLHERFYRVDASRCRGTGGRGLGLAIARGIALRHGGELEVESQIGEGTTVRLWLQARLGPDGAGEAHRAG